jgi:hypothetical protein
MLTFILIDKQYMIFTDISDMTGYGLQVTYYVLNRYVNELVLVGFELFHLTTNKYIFSDFLKLFQMSPAITTLPVANNTIVDG